MKEKKLNLTVVLGWVVSLICAFIGGSTIDFSPTINSYTEQIDKLQEEIKKKDEKIASLTEDKNKNIASLTADCKVTGERWKYLEDAFPDGPYDSKHFVRASFRSQGEEQRFGFGITPNLECKYKLDKKYQQISFDVYEKDKGDGKDSILLIYDENDELLFEKTFKDGFVHQKYDVNVYGVKTLKFIGKHAVSSGFNAGLANIKIYY